MNIAKLALLALGLSITTSQAAPETKAKTPATKTQTAKSQPKKSDGKKTETKKVEAKKADTKKSEAKKAEAKKAESKKTDKKSDKKANSKKTEPQKTVAKKAEPKKADKKQVSKKADAPKANTSKTVAQKAAPKSSPAKANQSVANKGKSVRDSMLKDAHRYIGTPYRWAGTTPRGFDCSGYTSYIMQKQGISIPRSSRDQFSTLPRGSGKRGDLVFFYKKGTRTINHVGIYLGNGKMLHAPQTGSHVKIADITIPYWQQRMAGYRDPFGHRQVARK